jgi:sugar lactone lactonase YvrE
VFGNDVVVDSDGSMYVTDTALGCVYRSTSAGQTSTFVCSPDFAAIDGLGPNGIELYSTTQGEKYLIVALSNRADALYRVNMANPEEVHRISITGLLNQFTGLDGVRFLSDGSLAAVNTVLC